MINSYWNSLIKRIQSEATWRNGKTRDGVSRVNISVIVQDGKPVLWEVVNSAKVEPSCDVTEILAAVNGSIRQLSERCNSPCEVEHKIASLIDNSP